MIPKKHFTLRIATPQGTASPRYTVTAKSATKPEPSALVSTSPTLALLGACVQRCRHRAVGSFVASFLHETEISDVMARAVCEGEKTILLGNCIDHAAVRMRNTGTQLGSHARDSIYAAALLVGIAAEIQCYGDSTPTDLVRSITCLALHRLDDSDPVASSYVRELLGWGNTDEIDEEVAPYFSAAVRQYLDDELHKQVIRSQALMANGLTVLLPSLPPAQGALPH
jgi:hypothetical protein